MPNHVRNVLKFKKLTPEDKTFLLEMICSHRSEAEGAEEIPHIDFRKIIPEPQEESECPEDCIVNKDSHISADLDRPWFDWYKWRLRYWDTKWNAYDSYTELNKTAITFVFNTAWSMPKPIIRRLQVLGYPFEYRWADEDLGHNCGKITWSSEQGWSEAWESDAYTDPTKFAQRLWREY